MIRIFKTYEGSKELREITEIERESWVMMTDPKGAELQMVAEKYQIDLDDLRAPLDEEERSRLEHEDNYTMILANIPVVRAEEGKRLYETIPLGIFITEKVVLDRKSVV